VIFAVKSAVQPTDHGYKDVPLKYEDYWLSPGYSQGLAVIPGHAQAWTRNLEIPQCATAHLRFASSTRPGMTVLNYCFRNRPGSMRGRRVTGQL
jgi:hypothetical protein